MEALDWGVSGMILLCAVLSMFTKKSWVWALSLWGTGLGTGIAFFSQGDLWSALWVLLVCTAMAITLTMLGIVSLGGEFKQSPGKPKMFLVMGALCLGLIGVFFFWPELMSSSLKNETELTSVALGKALVEDRKLSVILGALTVLVGLFGSGVVSRRDGAG